VQHHRALDSAPVDHERHLPDQTTLYRPVQQQAATFFAETEDAAAVARIRWVDA
jgi:hypothetical protein